MYHEQLAAQCLGASAKRADRATGSTVTEVIQHLSFVVPAEC